MAQRTADARWEGNLRDGKGSMRLGGGAFEGNYSFSSRFEEGGGTNPEELLAAAHAGCFSMALANALAIAGHTANSVETKAMVTIEKTDAGFGITRIRLECEADVPGLDPDEFQKQAVATKTGCPVSKALAAVQIDLDARLR